MPRNFFSLRRVALISIAALLVLPIYLYKITLTGSAPGPVSVSDVYIPSEVKTQVSTAAFNHGFYVVTMLSIFNGKAWPRYSSYTVEELNGRDEEYLAVLQANINRDYVKEVRLFYMDESSLQTLKSRILSNKHKIVPVKRERKLHMADFFTYSSRHLIDKPVIAMNSDIMLGDGFEYIDTERMRDEKVLYSLTRHGVNKTENGKCSTLNMCLDVPYQGSHDTHIFRLAAPLNETIIVKMLDYPINMWQAENGMLWTFRNVLKFTVRNPCRVLLTYHYHCSKVHGPAESTSNEYSIVKIPTMNWVWRNVLDSFTPIESNLSYREKV